MKTEETIWGKRIKKIRKEKGLTLLDLAKKLNKSESTVHRYETGNIREIPYNELCTLAQILQTTPSYLMGWEEPPTTLTPEEQSIIDIYRQLKPSTKEDVKKYLNYRLADDELTEKTKPKTNYDSGFDLKIAARSGKSEVKHLTKEEARKLQEYLDKITD